MLKLQRPALDEHGHSVTCTSSSSRLPATKRSSFTRSGDRKNTPPRRRTAIHQHAVEHESHSIFALSFDEKLILDSTAEHSVEEFRMHQGKGRLERPYIVNGETDMVTQTPWHLHVYLDPPISAHRPRTPIGQIDCHRHRKTSRFRPHPQFRHQEERNANTPPFRDMSSEHWLSWYQRSVTFLSSADEKTSRQLEMTDQESTGQERQWRQSERRAQAHLRATQIRRSGGRSKKPMKHKRRG